MKTVSSIRSVVGFIFPICGFPSLLFFAFQARADAPFSFGIKGISTISCSASGPTEYRAALNNQSSLTTLTSHHRWRWHVEGGRFADGSTDFVQKGTELPIAQVAWQVNYNHIGKISLELFNGDQLLHVAEQRVYLGLFAPTGILIEEGVLSCDGNWFVVETQFPLGGDEIIEWEIVNGLDLYNRPLGFISKQGKDANRLYIAKADQAAPLQVTVRIISDCGKATRTSKPIAKEFDYPKTRLTGKEYQAIGTKGSFAVCNAPSGRNNRPIWRSSGTITDENESSVTVQFPEEGIHEVSMIFKDCAEAEKTITKYITVTNGQSLPDQAPPNKYSQKIGCRVFPNPSHGGILNVELAEEQEGQLELLNLQGKLIYRQQVSTKLTTLDTGYLSPGIYLVRVVTSAGEHIAKIGINQI